MGLRQISWRSARHSLLAARPAARRRQGSRLRNWQGAAPGDARSSAPRPQAATSSLVAAETRVENITERRGLVVLGPMGECRRGGRGSPRVPRFSGGYCGRAASGAGVVGYKRTSGRASRHLFPGLKKKSATAAAGRRRNKGARSTSRLMLARHGRVEGRRRRRAELLHRDDDWTVQLATCLSDVNSSGGPRSFQLTFEFRCRGARIVPTGLRSAGSRRRSGTRFTTNSWTWTNSAPATELSRDLLDGRWTRHRRGDVAALCGLPVP